MTPDSKLKNLRALQDRIGELFAQKARAMGASTNLVSGAMILGGAALAGLAPYIGPAGPDTLPWGTVGGILGATLAFLGGAWSLFNDQTAPTALEEARKALDAAVEAETTNQKRAAELQQLEEQFVLEGAQWERFSEWQALFISTTMTLIEGVENLVTRGGAPDETTVQKLVDLESLNLTRLLRFKAGEYWTLAVYKYDTTEDCLECVAHMRAHRGDERNTHRTWAVGEGIAGQCFQLANELVVADLTDQQQASWLYLREENQRPDDHRKYRSCAAVPVMPGASNQCWGVVITNSDQAGRFQPEADGLVQHNLLPVRILAMLLAIIVSNSQRGTA